MLECYVLFTVFGSDAGGLVRALTKFSHLAADTITNGSATAHMAPTDDADRKSTHCGKHLHMHKLTAVITWTKNLLMCKTNLYF